MRCPVCLIQDTKVNDSRLTEEGFIVKRRRRCQKCGFKFSTYEQMEILNLTVVKRNGGKEPYQREKLENGLKRALEKRPITSEQLKKIINRIERDIQKIKRGDRAQLEEITSQQIGEMVMKRLKSFDKVAYIRFASVYRAFEDVKTFQKELSSLLKENKGITAKKNLRKK